MTENKRFTIEYVQGNPTIFHIVENGEHIDEIKIVDLLNGLHEENQELKQLIKKMGEVGGFNKHMIKIICDGLE